MDEELELPDAVQEEMTVSELLSALLELTPELESLDLPLMDAHGATLAADIIRGDEELMLAGSRIRSTHIALASSVGLASLPATPHPRVVVISAGDDLVEPGQRLRSAQDEFETNSWMLATTMKEAGAIAYRVHTIPETPAQLRQIIEDQLVRADLIVLSGETKDESFDFITSVLSELGEITTLTPNLEDTGRHNFGLIGPDQTPVITLPGEPIAAYLSAQLFVRPMIRTMLGAADLHLRMVKAELTQKVVSPKGKVSLVRAKVFSDPKLRVTPLPNQDQLSTLSQASGLITFSSASTGANAGQMVDVALIERSI